MLEIFLFSKRCTNWQRPKSSLRCPARSLSVWPRRGVKLPSASHECKCFRKRAVLCLVTVSAVITTTVFSRCCSNFHPFYRRNSQTSPGDQLLQKHCGIVKKLRASAIFRVAGLRGRAKMHFQPYAYVEPRLKPLCCTHQNIAATASLCC